MRVVFMGTPLLAARVLGALLESHEVVGVFTRPDAVRSRGRKLIASPVKEVAENAGVPVFTPSTFEGDEAIAQLKALKPDVACVAAYGMILPKAALDVPPLGCLNVHTSLLPRWRGAAPIERAILAGDEQTGVCIMRMEEGLDTGDYCVRKTCAVGQKYLGQLVDELSAMGAEALLEALRAIERGDASWTEQGQDGLTYASKLIKGELDVDERDCAADIMARVRASSASHPCRASIAGRSVALERVGELRAEVREALGPLAPGEAAVRMKRLVIGTSDGPLEVLQLKPAGKSSMEARSFAAGVQGMRNQIVKWGSA